MIVYAHQTKFIFLAVEEHIHWNRNLRLSAYINVIVSAVYMLLIPLKLSLS